MMIVLTTALTASSCCPSGVQPGDKLSLVDGWTLRSEKTGKSYDAKVPSTVAGTLFENGFYTEDIFRDDNYRNLDRTLFDSPWTYSKRFKANGLAGKHAFLQFDGIGYRADISLNGKQLRSKDTTFGVFNRYTLDVTDCLKNNNTLKVTVERAQKGDLNNGYVDWNPRPLDESMGIVRPVTLHTTGAVSVEDVYVVPGNHDKEWNAPPKEVRELINKHVAELKNPEKALEEWLQGSIGTLGLMYTPFRDYEEFAYKYGCSEPLMHRYSQGQDSIEASYDENDDRMYWVEEEFAEIDGYSVKLYGLNTSLFSDVNDFDNTPKRMNGHKMLLSKIAYNGAKCEDWTVNILMMHHPIQYLENAEGVRGDLDRLYHIQFFGHVHVANSDNMNNRVHVYSGALQPDEMDDATNNDYMPTYNIVDLHIKKGDDKDTLMVKLSERVWKKTRFMELSKPQEYSIEMKKNNWEGETMEPVTKLPEGVTKRDVRLKLINNGKAKKIIEKMDSAFYNEDVSLYYNVMRFLEKVRRENKWEELWTIMNS